MEIDVSLGKVLITEEAIKQRVKELGEQITKDYAGKELICVAALKGASIFLADLVREIGPEVDLRFEFITLSSYGNGTESSGKIQLKGDVNSIIEGRNVLIVEDILDTGNSLAFEQKHFAAKHPASLATCVCFDKPDRRVVQITADYTGFTIPNAFVFGYGLDYAQKYRNIKSLMCI